MTSCRSLHTHTNLESDPEPDASQVKSLLKTHKNDVSKWLNIPELLSHLCQRRLISAKARQRLLCLHERGKRSRIRTLLTKALASLQANQTVKPDAYTVFLYCLRAEHEHLGHRHIANLLGGVGEVEYDVKMSLLVSQAMQRIETTIQRCLCLKDLLPFLRQKKLLTSSEYEMLQDGMIENCWKIQKFFCILETKGPVAHYLFFQCLEEEKGHKGHEYIYKQLCLKIDENRMEILSTVDITEDQPSLRMCGPHIRIPCRLGLEGSLVEEAHIDEMRTLQQHRYHGRWDCFRKGIDGLTASEDLNVTAVGKLHDAVANIMYGNTILSLRLVDEVKRMSPKLCGNNNQIIIGRCLYIQSAVYRHRQDYDSARYYLDLSKQKLNNSEPGADTASLYYHEGTLQLDLLQQRGSHDRKERDKAANSFQMAIEHAEHNNSGLPLIAWHSKVFLALLYIGSSHDSISHEKPSKYDLGLAESILNTLDRDQLPPRTLALYHIAYSDIHRWKSDLPLARRNAKLGLTKAEQGNFAFEKRFASHRLQGLLHSV